MNTDEDISVAEVRRALDKFLKSRGLSLLNISAPIINLEDTVEYILHGKWSCELKSKIGGRVYTPKKGEGDYRKPTNMGIPNIKRII